MQEKEAYDILYNLSPAQFSHVRSVAKIWYVTSAPAWKPTWYEKHHVNEDYLEAVDFLVAKHGRYGMGDVLLHFENYRFPQKDLRAGTQKYFDKEFKHSKLDSLEDLMDYIERYCLDKRASRQSNQAMNKRTQPTKSIRQTTYYRRKANIHSKMNGNPRTPNEPSQPLFTYKGVFWLLLIIFLIIGMIYDNGPVQANAQIISLVGVCGMSIFFNRDIIGWRMYVLLLVSVECLAVHPLLAIASVFVIVPALSGRLVGAIQNLITH